MWERSTDSLIVKDFSKNPSWYDWEFRKNIYIPNIHGFYTIFITLRILEQL